tara:strand:+ start:65 stop:1156 length:1092 start_codon:yes stop_codon:yes gene_type:complete
MAKLKTYSEFVNEALIDAIKSPIKYTKIKNNAKKYQKAKVAIALNTVDAKKKRAASKVTLTPKQKASLDAATSAKNDSLKGIATEIGNRMDDLATTPGLEQVVKVAKTKSRLDANKKILKAATGEEAKQLKIKVKKGETSFFKAKSDLKDYESTEPGDKSKKDTPSVKSDKDSNSGTSTDDRETTAEVKNKQDAATAKMKGQTDGAKAKMDKDVKDNKDKTSKSDSDDGTDMGEKGFGDGYPDQASGVKSKGILGGLEGDIKAYNKNIEEERLVVKKKEKELEQAKRDQKLGRVSDEEILKIEKGIEDSTEDIAELKLKEKNAKKELAKKGEEERKKEMTKKESFEPLVESVSEKFARLRPNL